MTACGRWLRRRPCVAALGVFIAAAECTVAQEVTRIGAEFQVNVHTRNFQVNPDVALDDQGDFVVVWQSFGQDGSYNGVFARRFSGHEGGDDLQVNLATEGQQSFPRVGAGIDSTFFVTWRNGGGSFRRGVLARRLDATGAPAGPEVVVASLVDAALPALSVDDEGQFVVAWSRVSSGIFARRFDESTVPVGSVLRVSSSTSGSFSRSAVEWDGRGGFAVFWDHGLTLSDIDVLGRFCDAGGLCQGVEHQINAFTASSQAGVDVASGTNGDSGGVVEPRAGRF